MTMYISANKNRLDPTTSNDDTGLYWDKSTVVVLDQPFGEMAHWIQATQAGNVTWRSAVTGDDNVIHFEAGEAKPLRCDMIKSSGTVPTELFWIRVGF